MWSEPIVAALPSEHALAGAARVRPHDLADEPFVRFPRRSAPRCHDQLITACQRAGFSPNIVQEAVAMSTVVSLVAARLGVSLVPRSLHGLARPNVAYVPLDADVRAEIAMITAREEHRSALLDRFTSSVRRTLS